MRLNLEDANVFQLDLTVDEAREYDAGDAEDGSVEERIGLALDEAQAPVFGGDASESFLVIRIVKE